MRDHYKIEGRRTTQEAARKWEKVMNPMLTLSGPAQSLT